MQTKTPKISEGREEGENKIKKKENRKHERNSGQNSLFGLQRA